MPLRQESSASQEDEAFDQHAAPDCVECTKRLLSLVGHDFVKFDRVVWDNWSKTPLPFHLIWKFSAGWIEVPACEHLPQDLSRYPPPMMQGLAGAMPRYRPAGSWELSQEAGETGPMLIQCF